MGGSRRLAVGLGIPFSDRNNPVNMSFFWVALLDTGSTMLTRLFMLVTLGTLVAAPVVGQTSKPAVKRSTPASTKPPADALTNDKILKMVQSGLPDDIVVGVIQKATNKRFDTSPDALVALKTASVSD